VTAAHRPLSPWITRWPRSHAGPVGVNDGDERADAREWALFSAGWQRTAVPLGAAGTALGLRHGNGSVVVELDDFGRPIVASPGEVDFVSKIEENWLTAEGTATAWLARLAHSSLSLRFWLVERWRSESEPPDEIYAILPWQLLDRAVQSVLPGLRADGEVGELVEIGHWLSPAILGPPGALEQLDHGLRTGDTEAARAGASALLSTLRDMPVERVPGRTREILLRLVRTLGEVDPLYTHLSRVVEAQLRGAAPVRRLSTTLDSRLAAAASNDDSREIVATLGEPPHQISLVETQAGRLELTAQVPAVGDTGGPLGRLEAAFLPVRITPEDSGVTSIYWVALEPEADYLVGDLVFLLPRGRSALDADDAPVGPAELAGIAVEELLPSLYAATGSTVDRWREIAGSLSEHHPVRRALTRYEDQR